MADNYLAGVDAGGWSVAAGGCQLGVQLATTAVAVLVGVPVGAARVQVPVVNFTGTLYGPAQAGAPSAGGCRFVARRPTPAGPTAVAYADDLALLATAG